MKGNARMPETTQYPDLVIVGAGLFGLTVAQQAVEHTGARVRIIDIRDHIGGNAYSYFDEETGAEIHKYGAHLFHTSNKRVWDYVNRFTSFTNYVHRVYATHDGEVYPLPINLGTINQFFHAHYTPAEAQKLIAGQAGELAGTIRRTSTTRASSSSAVPCTRRSSRTTRASSGRPILLSCPRRSSSVCRCASTTTTAISRTRGRVCPRTATPSGWNA